MAAVREVINPRVAVDISTIPTFQDLLKAIARQLFPVIPPNAELTIRVDQQSRTVFLFV